MDVHMVGQTMLKPQYLCMWLVLSLCPWTNMFALELSLSQQIGIRARSWVRVTRVACWEGLLGVQQCCFLGKMDFEKMTLVWVCKVGDGGDG